MSNYEEDKKDVVYGASTVAPAHQAALPETDYSDEPAEVQTGLKRQLKSRHMAMISIGGVM